MKNQAGDAFLINIWQVQNHIGQNLYIVKNGYIYAELTSRHVRFIAIVNQVINALSLRDTPFKMSLGYRIKYTQKKIQFSVDNFL